MSADIIAAEERPASNVRGCSELSRVKANFLPAPAVIRAMIICMVDKRGEAVELEPFKIRPAAPLGLL